MEAEEAWGVGEGHKAEVRGGSGPSFHSKAHRMGREAKKISRLRKSVNPQTRTRVHTLTDARA